MIAIVAALALAAAPGEAPDPWLAPDKIEHGLASAFIGESAFAVSELVPGVRGKPLERAILALTFTLGVGIVKEMADNYGVTGRVGSERDLAWDAAGAVVGVVTGVLIEHFVGRGSGG